MITRSLSCIFEFLLTLFKYKSVIPLLCLPVTLLQSQIQTDGSMGSAQSLQGPDYRIDEVLGRRSGSNLFHSFSDFNIHTGESATFTGASDIANVISRVTGGNASTINGLLKSEIAGADFYLINSSGVLFGPNASLSISGAFHTSTADYLRLGDSDLFFSEPLQGEILSTAAPAAFGFFGVPRGDIEVAGSQLELMEGATFSLVGGEVTIDDGAGIHVPQGQINLVSANAAGEASFDASQGYQDLNTDGIAQLGEVALLDGSQLTVDGNNGNSGGRVVIRGEQMVFENSKVLARTTGEQVGSISVEVDRLDVLGEVGIEATAGSSAAAGTIDLSTPVLTVNGFDAAFQVSSGIGEFVRLAGGKLILDGSLNPDLNGVVLAGPNYRIESEYGEISGSNLFHSFREFLLDEGEIASFLGPEGITTIVTRVTGDNITSIYGQLSSNIPGADLYFINPNGLFFGNGASLDLSGSFHIGTADYLKFSDGGRFDVSNPTGSSLDGSDVSAFGFVDNEIGSILMEDSLLSSEGGTISLVGGNLRLRSFRIIIPSGKINLISLQSAGEASIMNGNDDFDLSEFDTLDDIYIFDNSRIVVNSLSESPVGRIFVRGKNLGLDNNGDLRALNGEGLGPGGSIDVAITGDLSIAKNSGITISGLGDIGQMIIDAGNITINGSGQTAFTGIDASQLGDFNTGDGLKKNVLVTAHETLSIVNGGVIDIATFGDANAGSAEIKAKNLIIDRQGSVDFTGIFSASGTFLAPGGLSYADITGDGGQLDILVEESLEIINNGLINSSTYSLGDGGNVTIRAKNLTIENQGAILSAAIPESLSNPEGSNITGNGGELNILVKEELKITNDGRIDTSTVGVGDAGKIKLQAKDIIIEGQSFGFTGIKSTADLGSIGNGGEIDVVAENRIKINAGAIEARAGRGNAGNLRISAGGDVQITDGLLSISAGQENFDLNDLDNFQQPELVIKAGNSIRIENSILSTDAGVLGSERGAGGDIYLLAPTEIRLIDSTLLAQAGYSGGNVFIDPQFYIVINSDVIAQADVLGGNYSVIVTEPFGWIQSTDSLIDLSGEQSGSVLSNASPFDLGAELNDFDLSLLNLNDWVLQPCEFRLGGVGSSFVVESWRGVSNNPDDFLPSDPILIAGYGFSESEPIDDAFLQEFILPELNDGCDDCP